MSSILVAGTVAFDTVETPHARAEEVLGGSAAYFAVAASYFVPVRLVAVVGEDFPAKEKAFLASRGVDLAGLEARSGKTFRWTGKYHEDMNIRDTLDTQLNVFADFSPVLPQSYHDTPYVFLANINPGLQSEVLDQLTAPQLIACDTMNLWIEGARPELEELLQRVEVLVINDEEARMLSGERNVVRAARKILAMGPHTLLIKRGEYGVLQFSAESIFAVPAYPLEEVFDPTGAGDSFAGGFLGYLASCGDLSQASIRKAIVYGSVVASFVVEDFSLGRLRTLKREEIDHRYRQFVSLTDF
jgi:sugar/nucleoside kinase (ribokinase family)